MKISSFIAIFLLSTYGFSQNTFNIRTTFGFKAAIAGGVIPTDSSIYLSGAAVDTTNIYTIASFLSKLDNFGNVQFVNKISSLGKWYHTTVPTFVSTNDGGFGLSGLQLDSIIRILLLKFQPNGDTVFLRNYLHPLYPIESLVTAQEMVLTDDNGFFIVGELEMPQGVDNTDILMLKTDSTGEEIFKKNIGTITYDEEAYSVIKKEDGFIIGAIRRNNNLTNQNYIFRTLLIAVDNLGNLQWSWLSPESWGLRDGARDMVLLDDGSLVVASGIGHEQQRPSVNVVYFDKAVFKLNPQRQIEWEVVFPDSVITYNSYTTNIIRIADGSGFVVAGITTTFYPPPIGGDIEGWIVKLGNNGETKWIRKHVYLTNHLGYHKINDLKECPDKGIIICGEATDLSDTASIPQQAWIMKVDSFGCLIPGCHLTDATEETREESTLLLYPNPARDYLNFFYRPAPKAAYHEVGFRILDASGREMQRFEAQPGERTYIVPVWHWPPGVYFLQVLHDDLPVRTERFVVGR